MIPNLRNRGRHAQRRARERAQEHSWIYEQYDQERQRRSALHKSQKQSMQDAVQALSRDSRVVSVRRLEKNGLEFCTQPMIAEIAGHSLLAGAYRARLNRDQFKVTCMQTFCHDGATPFFAASYNGGFCFGSRIDYLNALLAEGEYLAASYTILDSLTHINPDHHKAALERYMHTVSCKACKSGYDYPEQVRGATHERLSLWSPARSREFARS